MQEFDISTIVFALLAAFVVWKLRSVLGERTGDDPPSRDKAHTQRQAPDQAANGNAAEPRSPHSLAGVGNPQDLEAMDPAIAAGIEKIVGLDRSFSPAQFVEGAKSAYEIIISAFAAGDRQTLKGLLSREVLESFTAALADREARGHAVQTTFVSIDGAQIKEAQLRGRTAHISVRFDSKLITATKDREGLVVDGSPDKVVDVVDIWTFTRDLGTRDPNWRLAATEAVS